MTFVGKILVIVIMAFSLVFLGISTVVFTTATNWKAATADAKKKVDDLTKKNNDLTAALDVAKNDMEKAKADHAAAEKASEERIAHLNDEVKSNADQATAAKSKLEVAQQSASVALAEAAENHKETLQIRDLKAGVEKQANEFKIQHTELNDKIRELERQNKTLDDNNKDLKDRVARYSTLLRKAGLSDDIRTVKGLESPPPVEGVVLRADAQNRRVELSIGSDDGLVVGHELFLYRSKPRPEYLGKVQIMSVDPDQAVGKVIGKTVQGKKIQEGDIVSSTIRPRS
jgi:hypothetical protein